MNPVSLKIGQCPILLAIPHASEVVPDKFSTQLTPVGQTLIDTDWAVDRLYEGLLDDATIVKANFHRYVIDANRPPDDASLYPGQNSTGLVPLTSFDGKPLWLNPPTPNEISDRFSSFYQPYHQTLREQIIRLKANHKIVIVYDCHSIRNEIPFLFKGQLPDFNIGTDSGRSCDPLIEATVAEICQKIPAHSSVVNGRFKGGWTTRHYGQPPSGVHAIQMELSQSLYLENNRNYCETKGIALRGNLRVILERLDTLARNWKV